MTLKRSSPDPFRSLLRVSCRKSCFVQIITFAIFFLDTIFNYYLTKDYLGIGEKTVDETVPNSFGFFWNYFLTNSGIVFLIAIEAILAAITLFNFVHKKNRCNVIFSLGLSRRKIFLAKYLAGILPYYAAILTAAACELLSVHLVGFSIGVPILKIALYFTLYFTSLYTLFFTVTSTALAFSGNIIEGGIFTAIIMIFPIMANAFSSVMRQIYTLGGAPVCDNRWNFFNPYMYLGGNLFNEIFAGISEDFYYQNDFMSDLSIYVYSGAIMGFAYSAIILAIAIYAFQYRKNENSGSFGRSKGLNEICGAMVGFYVSLIAIYNVREISEHKEITVFVTAFAVFAVVYFVFKMIFGYKRKRIAISSLKRLTAYVTAFAAVTVIFSTGLFGYSSYVPKAEDVTTIEFSASVTSPYSVMNNDAGVHRESEYGYAVMDSRVYYDTPSLEDFLFYTFFVPESYYPSFSVTDKSEIERLIEIHKSLAERGKLKANDPDACGLVFTIDYTLSGGKKVRRFYSVSTEDTAKAILGLSDLTDSKKSDSDMFLYSDDEFYIYSKDLKNSCYAGVLTEDLQNAILADIENQSSNETFFHEPDDEIGVIGFSFPWNSKTVLLKDNETADSDGNIYNTETNTIIGTVRDRIINSGNLGASVSITSSTNKCIVITKDMVNTIKYLTDNGLMRYFNSEISAKDVKKIKLATKSESVGKTNSEMLPLFAAAYSNAADIKQHKNFRENVNHEFAKNHTTSVTDKDLIQKLLDRSFIYGYCGNDYRIIEVSYNDGSIATYCITGEDYAELMN